MKKYKTLDELLKSLDDISNKYIVLVFTESSFDNDYSLEERSYVTNTDWGKYFKSGLGGKSMIGNCLDKKDLNVRLDWYIYDEWKLDYCYLITEEEYHRIFG